MLIIAGSFVIFNTQNKIPAEPITALIEEYIGQINNYGRWDIVEDKNWTYSIVEVKQGEVLSFKCYGLFYIAFLSSYKKPNRGDIPMFVSTKEYSNKLMFHAGEHKLIVPNGARYLYFSRMINGSDSTPRFLYINYENVLEGIHSDETRDYYDDNPMGKQQVCIHHDSFSREINDDKQWHIGDNGGQVFAMNYVSPRKDYYFVDDGFRISNSCLKNDVNVPVYESFRLIERSLSEESLIEISLPFAKSAERVVFNFKDCENFDSYRLLRNEEEVDIEYISRTNGNENKRLILQCPIKDHALRFYYSIKRTIIYLDHQKIAHVEKGLDSSLKCGLMIDKIHSYTYDFFNVYNILPFKVYDEMRFTDKGIKQTHAGLKQGWVNDYSYTLDSNITCLSPYAERFELRRNTITDYSNDRVEKSFNYQLQTNLRKIKVEFDVLIPSNNVSDESFDCIMQIHDRADDPALIGRSPYFAIRVKNNQFYLTTMSIEKHAKIGFVINKIIPLIDCKLGKWSHFSIYIKEGYIPAHNPLTKIMIDEKLVYESNEPNANNNPRGGYIRYGIYKADWLKNTCDTSKQNKVVYFDNFKIIM